MAVFHFEHSVAITQWAALEQSLFRVVAKCFNEGDINVLALGFVSIENFRSKLQFADRTIMRKHINTQHGADWKSLYNRLKSSSTQRNNLVHYPQMAYPHNTAGRRYALIPWVNEKHQNRAIPPKGSLCIKEIIKVRYEFFAINLSLANFGCRLSGIKEQFPKSSEQAMHPPTILQLKNQMHELLGHPQKSSREKRKEQDAANAAASLTQTIEGKNE